MHDLADVRVFVYRRFAERGDPPRPEEVAAEFGVGAAEALEALGALHDAHLLVLDEGRRRIVMAHPWSAVPLGFVVAGRRAKWWGGCAWDSFAIPALVGEECLVATHCPGCGRALALDVCPGEPPTSDLMAHFLVPIPRMWDDVMFACGHQALFCSEEHVGRWLRVTRSPRGALLDMRTLWLLATRWYTGRLTKEYRRRTPDEARALFQELGLAGPFWGDEAPERDSGDRPVSQGLRRTEPALLARSDPAVLAPAARPATRGGAPGGRS
ncbi:organomercurial lyase [Sphaerisporangium sp. TRM90804]|uniref:organomercurial lyase n=1 Tax=Sphaerisporangium sp. TRM90804 TaxID=3031113 RepID=UPI002446B97C|nr:organomercurial lyase [Sphaerisporangium sp. TRM90804]MDH2430699.1 organomercurial lyase [Sphaerisporangium sp. TRM90804]